MTQPEGPDSGLSQQQLSQSPRHVRSFQYTQADPIEDVAEEPAKQVSCSYPEVSAMVQNHCQPLLPYTILSRGPTEAKSHTDCMRTSCHMLAGWSAQGPRLGVAADTSIPHRTPQP